MFRVKVYINDSIIEDIQAVNLGRRRPKSKPDERLYDVTTVDSLFFVYHNRDDGWEELLSKILKRMKEKK